METLLGLSFFIFGSIIGSFLNVVILRFRSGRGLGGRSLCFTCGKTLTSFELVPIASFLTQRGRCINCHAKISWQYPTVEALTGLLFTLLFFRFEYLLFTVPLLFVIVFAYAAFIVCLLIVLSVYDIKHQILPDSLSMLFAAVAFVGMFFWKGDALILHVPSAWHLVAGIVLAAPFGLLWLASRGKWMGLGDAKLMLGIGWLLGLSAGAAAIMLSFWIGALFSVFFLLVVSLRGKSGFSMKTAIPFGPFLALGTVIVMLGGFDFSAILRMFAR